VHRWHQSNRYQSCPPYYAIADNDLQDVPLDYIRATTRLDYVAGKKELSEPQCTSTTRCTTFDYVQDLTNYPECFLCPVSKKLLVEPVAHACGQMICKTCLDEAKACSSCDISSTDDETSSVQKAILQTVDNLLIKCLDCRQKVARGCLSTHRDTDCLQPCTNGCGVSITRAQLSNHTSVCLLETVACSAQDVQCPWSGHRGLAVRHQKSCQYVLLQPVLQSLQQKIAALEQTDTQQQEHIVSLETRTAKLEQLLVPKNAESVSLQLPVIRNLVVVD